MENVSGLVKTSELSKPRNCSTSGCATVRAVLSQALTSLLAVGLLCVAPLLPVFFRVIFVGFLFVKSFLTQHGRKTPHSYSTPNRSCQEALKLQHLTSACFS